MNNPPTDFNAPGEPPSHLDDESIIARVAGGDSETFAMLYDRHSSRLFGIAIAVLRDPDEAADVVQEVFLYIWRNAAAFDASRSKLTTWTALITRHKAIDHLRALRCRGLGVTVSTEAQFTEPVAAESPEEDAFTRDNRRLAVAALDSLPQDQRELLWMAFIGGLSHREIAERISSPLGTVKSLIRRALLRMRAGLQSMRKEVRE